MIKSGELIPDIVLSNDQGQLVRLHDFIGKNPLVIYFYPKNDTPGCVVEACSFRDHHKEFIELGAKIFGISGDSPASHARFRERYKLNFELLSDEDRIAENAFDVKRNLLGLLPGRVTFITDVNGVVRFAIDSSINPKKHIKQALKFLESSKLEQAS